MKDPFDTLGIAHSYTIDVRDLESRHRALSKEKHPDRHPNANVLERRALIESMGAVNESLRALKAPLLRAAALLEWAGRPLEEKARADQATLMEVLELREELEASKQSGAKSEERIAKLTTTVEAKVSACEATLREAFDAGEKPVGEKLDRAYKALVALRYYERFLEEARGDEE